MSETVMISPFQVVMAAETYARTVMPGSLMGQLAQSLCAFHNIDPWAHHNGLARWQSEIAAVIIRDTIIQLAKDQPHE